MNTKSFLKLFDAIEIQYPWGTGKREADINFDGKVDAKDMNYLQRNYLLQNQHVDDSPQPRKEYKGKH
jgi:hypothetical protein